jgi:hypothetical protein
MPSCEHIPYSNNDELQHRVVADRLGITPDEMDGGHVPALGRPKSWPNGS